MLTLIIADDERIIRETINSIIDWDSLGIQIAALCEDGLDAYDKIIREKPDIVITDIKMPGLSGLDLVKRISETDMVAEFILLSGYSEFEFAKTAMTYNVRHYLLKPCNEEQIIESVKKASEDVYRRKAISKLIPAEVLMNNNDNYNFKDYINKTIDYVNSHFSDSSLSLKYIASNVVFMNEDYISKEFYKQTGQKFTDYLTSVRIKKAKMLIQTFGDEKIYNIANKVGFANNPQYFARLFKNATGLTPKAFSQQTRRNKTS